MRILELEIHNIRGIRHLHLHPKGKTTVIFGPNGTGKSAVIDAIDFLLTGNINRLRGAGTGGITLQQHGKHVDADSEQSFVRAQLQLSDRTDPVEVVRRMSQPKDIEVDDAARGSVERVVSLASQRKLALTRRELLQYVTADGGTRAKAVEKLLNIQELEPFKRTLTSVRRTLKAEAKAAASPLQASRAAVAKRLGLEHFDAAQALERVNELRAKLDGSPLTELATEAILEGASRPSATTDHALRSALRNALTDLQSARTSSATTGLGEAQISLLQTLQQVADDASFDRRVALQRLASDGRDLLDDEGSCPLCETHFAPGDLLGRLQQMIERGQEAAALLTDLRTRRAAVASPLRALAQAVSGVVTAADALGGSASPTHLRTWASRLTAHADSVLNAAAGRSFDAAPEDSWTPSADVESELSSFAAQASDDSGPTPQEDAWDTLSKLEAGLQRLETAEATQTHAQAQYAAASALFDSFRASRDQVLSSLYDEVRERFESLYRTMNGDEHQFTARLEPDGASLDFTVDFHTHGQNPPHALHSEGHQDSMGLCLYLALAERLNQGVIDLVLLDDVVMSVDAGHRREFCRVLKQAFPDRQFLITTHDKVWASQLKSEGVVTSKQLLEFGKWDLATGPQVAQSDTWEEIATAMDRADVPQAAWRLRRGLEEFFGAAAGRLGAKVTYKPSGQYALEEVLAPACARLKDLLGKGKTAATSWNNQDEVTRLDTLDAQLGSARKMTDSERWAVNASVHYNGWADLSHGDFAPIVEAFRGLCAIFECPHCTTPVQVTGAPTPTDVRCACGRHGWSLTKKPKS